MMIKHGNSKSFVENSDLVRKTMNKEERYSHVLSLDSEKYFFHHIADVQCRPW